MTSNEQLELKSAFTFKNAKLVVLPPLGYVLIGENNWPFNSVVLEVEVTGIKRNPQPTLVEVEAWGQVAQMISERRVGDVFNVRGVVIGKPWVDRQGMQRYKIRLRAVEFIPQVLQQGTLADDDIGF